MRLFLILFLINATAWAETPSGSPFALRQMGVRIEKPAGDGVHFSQGSGVFVGEGMVLTAAHVVRPDPARRQVIVLLGGWRLDAALVDGAQDDDLDLALIQIPPQAMSIAHQP
ncbi:MAG TPA: trypsin-like peptidase domain-containing protein, partial [Rhodospirillaceae bacterium]|nr:trypsin-like peptidase domain-containing protein [Rhodospirillaceae bacterium]